MVANEKTHTGIANRGWAAAVVLCSTYRVLSAVAALGAVALFAPTTQADAATFNAVVTGPGQGVVTSSPMDPSGAIDCNKGEISPHDRCSSEGIGISPTFTATAEPGSLFAGWTVVGGITGSNCSGTTGTCTVTLFAGTSTVTASFGLDEFPPIVEIDPVLPDDISATEAVFHGRVNPEGSLLSSCGFEYLTQSRYEADGNSFENADSVPCEPAPNEIGEGESFIDVEATATGLEPNSEYRVRLIAAKSTGGVSDEAPAFKTDIALPEVSASARPGATMASLRGVVDPQNANTSYRFEYGLADCASNPCAAVPVPDGDAGAGGTPLAVFARAHGLTPETTYHFRLVAENPAGTAVTPDETFTTVSPSPARAYELVSPVPTGGVSVYSEWAAGGNGDRFLFSTFNIPLPGAETVHSYYLASRGETGWTSAPVDAPPQGPTWFGGGFAYASPDASRVVVETLSSLDSDDQNRDGPSGQDLYLRDPDGEMVWISRDPRIPLGTPQIDPANVTLGNASPRQAAMSEDGRTVVFSSQRELLDGDTTPGGTSRLYKWSDGELSLAGVLPDGTLSTAGSRLGSGPEFTPNAVSRNGSRVVFSSLRPGGSGTARALYVQVDGKPSLESTKACPACPIGFNDPRAVTYAGADREVEQVFFTSETRLTPDSGAGNASGGADLYRFDVDSGTLHDLTPRLDGGDDPTVTPALDDRARVRGVLAVSDDGSHVYFVAEAVLATGPGPYGAMPEDGAFNLYVNERVGSDPAGETRFIATLPGIASPGFNEANSLWAGNWSIREARTSPDGSVLAFDSAASLTGQPVGAPQIYVYEDDNGTLVCASCPGNGSAPSGRVNAGARSDVFISNQGNAIRRWVSTEGAVFFHTPTPLLNADTNQVDDVYEYRHGELRLLSAGTGSQKTHFFDASTDGATVFLRTHDALVPRDQESGVAKIYAARVGGGFAGRTLAPPPCFDGDCRATSSGPDTEELGAASSWYQGAGNLDRKRCKAAQVLRGGRCLSKRKLARRSCRKKTGKGRRRCIRRQVRRLNRAAGRDRGGAT